MKKTVGFIAMLVLLAGLSNICTYAQEVAPTKFLVFEEVVSPSDMPAYWEAQTKVNEQWAKHNFDVPVYSYLNDENTFYWVIPIENFASIDNLWEKFMAMYGTMKDDGFDADQAFRGLYSGSQMVIQWAKDLSYQPDSTTGQTEDEPFCEWMFCYLKSGHENDVDTVIKKYIDFNKNVNSQYYWDVYKVLLGHDTPQYIFMVTAPDEVALRTLEKEMDSKYRKEFMDMRHEFIQHLRKTVTKKGWYLPKMSHPQPD